MKIFLVNLPAEVGRGVHLFGYKNLHEISDDNGVRVVALPYKKIYQQQNISRAHHLQIH
jgi:hypothetical protein